MKQVKFDEFEGKLKYSETTKKLKQKITRPDGNEFPPVYPRIKDDPEKLIQFLRETRGTINWILTNWAIYRPEKHSLKKSFDNMWKIAKPEFNVLMELLSTNVIETPDSKRAINVEKELSKKGLTEESLESKFFIVDFGHVEMLLAYDDYENSVKSIKTRSMTFKIANKVGRQILKIRKSENQTASSKWLSAAIVIIGSVLDALGIKSPLTEFLELLALSVE